MSLETAEKIGERLAPFDPMRLEMAFRGEPLCNPNWLKILKIFRKHLPGTQITMYTNGDYLSVENVKKFFDNGGNVLSVDCYDDTLEKRIKLYKDFSVNIDGESDFDLFCRNNPKTTQEIVLIPDNFRIKKGLNRQLCNLAGNIDFKKGIAYNIRPLKKPLIKHCVKPFREIAILYNGDIKLCCLDGSETTKIYGNVYTTDLEDFWYNNKALNIARTMLYNKLRVTPPCNVCDFFGGGRFGFLPKYKTIPEDTVKKIKEKYY